MHVKIPEAMYALTVNGAVRGSFGIAATSVLLPGTHINLYSAGAGGIALIVVSNDSTGACVCRRDSLTKIDHYQQDFMLPDLSAWTVAGTAIVFVSAQIIEVDQVYRGTPHP